LLYRHRLLDRFYPPSPFGAGKPQAHWLLDEAGAILVAAILGVERRRLGWQRRDDWASHPQLRHRLELNRFVTDLIAATLRDRGLGVRAWYSSRDAAELLDTERLRPDAGVVLDTAAGAIECWLEWDRGTETQERLEGKLHGYWNAEHHLRLLDQEPRNILFVVPGTGRIETLRRALAHEQEDEHERVRRDRWHIPFQASWPMLAATASEIRRQGPLAPVWRSITDHNEPRRALTELPVRRDLGSADPALAPGRRWRHDQPDFWERLSPLHRPTPSATAPESACTAGRSAQEPTRQGVGPATPDLAPDPKGHAFHEQLQRLRQATLDEIQSGLADPSSGHGADSSEDLRPSDVDGLIPDPEKRPRRRGGVMAVTRVCLYTRISTDEENQPTSLHSQRGRLEAFCKAQEDWRIVAHKQDQATGTKLDRPGLQAALDLARSGAIDLLLVYRVDRLSRKVRQLAQLAEELDTDDVCSARRRSPSTPAPPPAG
jgi:Resolvase, N terminal domain/Replication-relaxation